MISNGELDTTEHFVIFVASSPNGSAALATFLLQLPPLSSAAVVIAYHTSTPLNACGVEQQLEASKLPVRIVSATETLHTGTISFVPPTHEAEIMGSDTTAIHAVPASKPSVDALLYGAAELFGEHLIVVVPSDTPPGEFCDLRAVKEAGGTVIIQKQEDEHPGSILPAIPAPFVDIVAQPENIRKILQELMNGRFSKDSDEQKQLTSLLMQVQDRCGIDFTQYKSPTIMRRLLRLMVANGFTSIAEYALHLQQHPEDYQRLANAFLIKVTEFFRDVQLYEQLRDFVLPQLIAEVGERSGELRIWSAGSSTGEEAYSLAILCAELLKDDRIAVRIFATDIDENAIAFARRGIYSREALRQVPESLIQRYFNQVGDSFEVCKRLRNMTVFGQHDLAQRAPFPRIDLCLCRNVMIYFTKELQARALQLFAFALRDGGYLVLGKAESTTPFPRFFRAINPTLKIYQREGDRVMLPLTRLKDTPPVSGVHRSLPGNGAHIGDSRSATLGGDPQRHAPSDPFAPFFATWGVGVVVVNRRYDIVGINPAARSMLQINGVGIGEDLIHLATMDSSLLRSIIDGAFKGETIQPIVHMLKDPVAGTDRYLQFHCYAQPQLKNEYFETVGLMIVDISEHEQRIRESEHQRNECDKALATHLARNVELAQRVKALIEANDELTATNASLRTYNEQLLINSEEAASANEEIETLNEEMQATNEELETLNEELQATVEELNTTNDELEARSAELERSILTREAALRTLQLEREALMAAIATLHHAVAVIDTSGTVLYASPHLSDAYKTNAHVRQWLKNSGDAVLNGRRCKTNVRPLSKGFSLVLFDPIME